MKNLSQSEINMVLEKIRSKYQTLIDLYKKNPVILENFQQRYITTLKMRKNLSVFLFAEIQAVEELIKAEEEKRNEAIKKRNQKKQISFVDRVMQENQRRYQLYPKIVLSQDSDDEINYLCGAARYYLNIYFPIAVLIEKRTVGTALQRKFTQHYDDLTTHVGYDADVPVARHYLDTLATSRDDSRIMFEYQRLIQNFGFLLNSSYDLLKNLIAELSDSKESNNKLDPIFREASLSGDVVKIFKGKTFIEAAKIILDYLEKLIGNFRLRDIRKV